MKKILAAMLLAWLCCAASLLPQGQTQFTDANGAPLAGGRVFFYIPNTTTFKQTWQDAAQTILNPNPVVLDAAGRATIYGAGQYRELVVDANGATQWDALTTDVTTSANGTFWGGTSTGTANAQVISATGFAAVDGQQISFVAGLSNTGPLTITPNANLGAIPVVIDSSGGPTPMTGGEIVIGNVVNATYTTSGGHFHITSALLGAGPGVVPTGTSFDFFGSSPPAGYLLEYGQCVSKVTYAKLFAVIGTSYGSCGAGFFAIPDSRGRVLAGVDNMGGASAGRLTSATMSPDGVTLGATGGTETSVLTTTELPASPPSGTVNVSFSTSYSAPASPVIHALTPGGVNIQMVDTSTSTSLSIGPSNFVLNMNNLGSGAAHRIVMPTVLANKIIKY